MSVVRPFRTEDALGVAELFQKMLLRASRPAVAPLAKYLVEVFLHHPWFDPVICSHVYVAANGTIRGFIGVVPVRFSFRGRSVRAAVAGSHMVDGHAGDPLAGARLLRSVFTGPQDLTISETANPLSHPMWLKLGARVLPGSSLEFLRILRPAGLGVSLLAQRSTAARFLSPLGSAVDSVLVRFAKGLLVPPREPRQDNGTSVEPRQLAEVIQGIAPRYALHPNFDLETLRWLLDHSAVKQRYGAPYARIVRNARGEPVGGYLAHIPPRGLGRVTQIIAAPGHSEQVADDLLAIAARERLVAITGRTQPGLLDPLMLRQCVFVHRSSTMVHCRSADILDVLERGDAFINGVAGETWMRMIGGKFQTG